MTINNSPQLRPSRADCNLPSIYPQQSLKQLPGSGLQAQDRFSPESSPCAATRTACFPTLQEENWHQQTKTGAGIIWKDEARMRPSRYFRNSSGALVLGRKVLMCSALLFVLVARSTQPNFSTAYLQATINYDSRHDHRLCFDHQEPQEVPACTFFSPYPRLASSCPTPETERLRTLQKSGFHPNRPPPALS